MLQLHSSEIDTLERYLFAISKLPDKIIQSYQILLDSDNQKWLVENYRINYKRRALYLSGLLGIGEVSDEDSGQPQHRYVFDVLGHLIDQQERFSISFSEWYSTEDGSIAYKKVFVNEFRDKNFADGTISELPKEIILKAELSYYRAFICKHLWEKYPHPSKLEGWEHWWYSIECQLLDNALRQSFIDPPRIYGKSEEVKFLSEFNRRSNWYSKSCSVDKLVWSQEGRTIQTSPNDAWLSYVLKHLPDKDIPLRQLYEKYTKANTRLTNHLKNCDEIQAIYILPNGEIFQTGKHKKVPKEYKASYPKFKRERGFEAK